MQNANFMRQIPLFAVIMPVSNHGYETIDLLLNTTLCGHVRWIIWSSKGIEVFADVYVLYRFACVVMFILFMHLLDALNDWG